MDKVMLTKIDTIANNCKDSSSFLDEIVKQKIFDRFFGQIATKVFRSKYENDAVIFNKIYSLTPGDALKAPKLTLRLQGNLKCELDSAYFVTHPQDKRKDIFADFVLDGESGTFRKEYVFKKDSEQEDFRVGLIKVFKKFAEFQIKEQPAVRELRKKQLEEARIAYALAEERKKEQALQEKRAKQEQKRMERLKKFYGEDLPAALGSADAVINSDSEAFYNALGYLAATVQHIDATVPVFSDSNFAIRWFEDTFYDMPYTEEVAKKANNTNFLTIYGPVFELKIPAKCARSAPEYLTTSLQGTAMSKFSKNEETAGALRPTGQLSNVRFIYRLVSDFGFRFVEKGTTGGAPTLEELLEKVPEEMKEITKTGYAFGKEVLSSEE